MYIKSTDSIQLQNDVKSEGGEGRGEFKTSNFHQLIQLPK